MFDQSDCSRVKLDLSFVTFIVLWFYFTDCSLLFIFYFIDFSDVYYFLPNAYEFNSLNSHFYDLKVKFHNIKLRAFNNINSP